MAYPTPRMMKIKEAEQLAKEAINKLDKVIQAHDCSKNKDECEIWEGQCTTKWKHPTLYYP